MPKIKYTELYLIFSLMYVKKFTSFCRALKKMHTKENWFFFSASRCRIINVTKLVAFVNVTVLLWLQSSSLLKKLVSIKSHCRWHPVAYRLIRVRCLPACVDWHCGVYETVRCPSVRLSVPTSPAAAACGGFAAVGMAVLSINQWSIGHSTARSSKCGQCRVFSLRRLLNTDLFTSERRCRS